MMLILVMAFFMLGCRFSCSGMKEDFAFCKTCNSTCAGECKDDGKCDTTTFRYAACGGDKRKTNKAWR